MAAPAKSVPKPRVYKCKAIKDNLKDKHFKYNEVKNAYMTSCSKLLHNEDPLKRPLCQAQLNQIMKFVLNAKSVPEELLLPLEEEALRYFDVTTSVASKKEILVLKGTSEVKLVDTTSAIHIVPYEDSFDILLRIHKELKHPTYYQTMLTALMPKYFISKIAVLCFAQMCNVCKHNRQLSIDVLGSRLLLSDDEIDKLYVLNQTFVKDVRPRNFRTKAYMDIYRMLIPDGNFKYLLFYIDDDTHYLLLRPLRNSSAEELAVELYKIFADFGTPLTIKASYYHQPLLSSAIKTLDVNFGISSINIIKSDLDNVTYHTERFRVLEDVSNWINSEDIDRWAVRCYIVQHNINNFNSKPFNATFGKDLTSKSPVLQETSEDIDIDDIVENTLDLTPLQAVDDISRIFTRTEEFIKAWFKKTQNNTAEERGSSKIHISVKKGITVHLSNAPEVTMQLDEETVRYVVAKPKKKKEAQK
uniref:Integrase catalytic domain-containing protein n=1 Tax=Pectinophora gossypiella TaxID=13191 RepID=A0A1E1W9U2_PECGO